MKASNNWKLSPSDLTFLWEECPRCFYMKIARKVERPRSPFPRIFSTIDLLMKEFFAGKTTGDIADELPSGVVYCGEIWVESLPISLPGCRSTCFLRGKTDTILKFRDESYGVVDFKTSYSRDTHIPLYSRQLHSYAIGLERPAPGRRRLAPVSKLGLLCVEPMEMLSLGSAYAFKTQPVWLECQRNDDAFLSFLGEVVKVLDAPEPPSAAERCSWCRWINTAPHLESRPARRTPAAL